MKIAKTYRFNPETLDKLEVIQEYWLKEMSEYHPSNKLPITTLIEYLIIQEHKRIILIDQEETQD